MNPHKLKVGRLFSACHIHEFANSVCQLTEDHMQNSVFRDAVWISDF